ncbi:TIGR04219 family outer membrane beta-barrel protein [Vibrio cholerae]|nr:TIGR04219 family outer membrane beta-barrel protein [Vibrio cholerae]EHZ6902523.1 TIGR04219 family outer membrane beta-barrel protein [Vibrio cholerae]EIE9612944.1 TIGR04219 family outer membrane beta-barrel protein [Vibrio cholerae]EJK2104169.1 TIGR04219 family outer membrane beta-barrel protein [Vibrio cholerae]EJL6646457.1 TIGR04219 family outer membrane beta-barrel protein [Vibrio cholerae]
MNRTASAALVTALMVMPLSASAAESFYTASVGAEMWLASMKIDNTRRDDANAPNLYFTFEHGFPYLPNVGLRYTNLEADFASFDKIDYTFYYPLLNRELMKFDAGITLTQYANSDYRAPDARRYDFDQTTFNWYASAEITIPHTPFDVIGQFDFGNNSDLKSSDVMAGLQYHLPIRAGDLSFKAGYRVVDLEFTELAKQSTDVKQSFVFADGWFVGAQFSF